MSDKNTDFGFNFGSIEVSRIYKEKGVSCVSIKTPKTSFSIRATKTGQVSIFDSEGNQCEIVSNDCMGKLAQ